jgi:hypothetical protein
VIKLAYRLRQTVSTLAELLRLCTAALPSNGMT